MCGGVLEAGRAAALAYMQGRCSALISTDLVTDFQHGNLAQPGAPHAEVDEQQRLVVLECLGVCCNIINMGVAPADASTT
jgi:hypothetical protein